MEERVLKKKKNPNVYKYQIINTDENIMVQINPHPRK